MRGTTDILRTILVTVLTLCGSFAFSQQPPDLQSTLPITLTHIQRVTPTADTSNPLPHFVSQNQSGLLQQTWQIELPERIHQYELPTLFIPQTVAGAVFSIHGQTFYTIAGSDTNTLRNNYTSALIPLPKLLLSTNGPTTLQMVQTGHLRGWYIPTLLVGELQNLQPLNTAYTYLGQTLSTTINIVCSLAGLFLLIIGLQTKEHSYTYGGSVTLAWALLFSLALLSELPTAMWHYWRLSLYLIIGNLIHFVCLFMTAAFRQNEPPKRLWLRLLILNLGWPIFAIGGQPTEAFLDRYWVAAAVGLYIVHVALVIRRALQLRQYRRIAPIALHWAFTSTLATHDYLLQAGLLQIVTPSTPIGLLQHLAQQPLYLTHLSLPAFVIMAFVILYKDHLQKIEQQKQQAKQIQEQRERLVNDIHDGVGSRINLLLWQLQLKAPSPQQIQDELRRCMDELRFAINPQESGHTTLANALHNLCERLQTQSQANGIQVDYTQTGQIQPLNTNTALQLYKIMQEGMANALRHSRASRIQLLLVQHEHTLTLTLQDNGQGIAYWDNQQQKQTDSQNTSMGLRSMQERAQHIPAQLHILSTPHGTQLQIVINTD